MNRLVTSILITGIALLSGAAHALPITYNINHTVGAYGTVTGTIETDGSFGTLTGANILNWDLYLNADANAATLGHLTGPASGGNSSVVIFGGSSLSAVLDGSISSLLYNFDAPSMYNFQIRTDDFSAVWQMQAGAPFSDELVRESFPPSNPIQEYQFRGAVTSVLGTGSVAATVPDPATSALFLIGLAGLFIANRKRSPLAKINLAC